MPNWDDREDFRPLGNRLQRVDQEAYCDEVQRPVVRQRRRRRVAKVGEQADYELDRILAGPLWDDDGWDVGQCPPSNQYTPRRPGFAAPPLVPASASMFPDLTAPVLTCGICEQPFHLPHPCTVGVRERYERDFGLTVPARQMELLEWAP